MKKLVWSSALVALLLVGCGEADTPDDTGEVPVEEAPDIGETPDADSGDEERDEEDTVAEEPAILFEDVDPIAIADYDSDKWFYQNMDGIIHLLGSEVFVEEDSIYLPNSFSNSMGFNPDFTPRWEHDNNYPHLTKIAVDENVVYNNDLAGKGKASSIDALDKATGEVVYQIDLTDYDEVSQVLIDDESIYLVLGYIEDPEEEMFADNYSLHAYDKANGTEKWAVDIPAVRLSGGRSHYYELTQSDDLIYLVEEENLKLVARSKDDGSEVWSQEFPEGDERIKFALTYASNGSVYVQDRNYVVHAFDEKTGERQAEFESNGNTPGAMAPVQILHGDIYFYTEVDETKHHLKAGNPKADELLWTMDLGENFLVDWKMLGDTLYAFIGSIDLDAEENTQLARINPETGEIYEVIDLGESISHSYNSEYSSMGLTVHDDTLVYHYELHLFGFTE